MTSFITDVGTFVRASNPRHDSSGRSTTATYARPTAPVGTNAAADIDFCRCRDTRNAATNRLAGTSAARNSGTSDRISPLVTRLASTRREASLRFHHAPKRMGYRPRMKTRAAVAFEVGKPLVVEEVALDGPKAGEVLVEIAATGVCHTDEFTRSGAAPEGLFPVILGLEGAGTEIDVGPGVTTLKKGDHVIPLYTPECRQCKSCTSHKTNLCTSIRATQGQGVMPDGTSRFSLGGKKIHHYMGCSTFSNFTVLPEIALAKLREAAPFDKACYIGCGVTTGVGAVIKTAKVEPGANVVVFGLGGIGLNVIQGARMAGANMIVGVDINPAREAMAKSFGMTHFVNPKEVKGDLVPQIVDWYMDGKIEIDSLITHKLPLERINEAFDLMHSGESIRTVIEF